MKRCFTFFLVSLILTTGVLAGERLPIVVPGDPPPFQMPDVGTAIISKGKLTLTYGTIRCAHKKNNNQREILVVQRDARKEIYDLSGVKCIGIDEKQISKASLTRRLDTERPVLYVMDIDRRKVNPFFLKVLKEDTLILILPYCPGNAPE